MCICFILESDGACKGVSTGQLYGFKATSQAFVLRASDFAVTVLARGLKI